ncbi:hypothetical protein ACOXXX_05075 [Thalassococcus sp. BH17M4-6]|uniref:hypothetical protein n=1 Tax=Thalassococcus sp. BH17M4-6 TaxID=3413148 RepID=UPI003BCE85FD
MRLALLPLLFLLLPACEPVQPTARAAVNLDYARTSLGYRNSGALSAGRLLLWDAEDNSLVTLQSEIPLGTAAPTQPVQLEATSVRGVQISSSATLSDQASAAIASKIRDDLSFVVKDAVRVNSTQVHSGISDAYKALQASGVNAFRAWRIADVTGDRSRYRFVVLTDEIRASEEEIRLDQSAGGTASFSIVDQVAGNVTVTVPASTTAKCSGDGVVCYVNAMVLRVFLNDSGNLDYEPSSFNSERLVTALRGLS